MAVAYQAVGSFRSSHCGANPGAVGLGDDAGDNFLDEGVSPLDELELVATSPLPVALREGLPGTVVRRPMPMPTRTSVSSEARPLMSRSSSHSTTPFSKRVTMVEPPENSTLH